MNLKAQWRKWGPRAGLAAVAVFGMAGLVTAVIGIKFAEYGRPVFGYAGDQVETAGVVVMVAGFLPLVLYSIIEMALVFMQACARFVRDVGPGDNIDGRSGG